MPFTNLDKSSSPSFTNNSKSSASFSLRLKHGKEPTMDELANFIFTDAPILDDATQLKDLTFTQLSDISWSNVNKS